METVSVSPKTRSGGAPSTRFADLALALRLLVWTAMRPFVLCALLVGCGFEAPSSSPEATVDAAPQPVTDDASSDATATAMTSSIFMERLITLECIAAFACKAQYPTDAHRSFAVAWGTDLDDCIVTDVDYLQRAKIEAAITGGTITWDPALAEACLAAPGIPSSCSQLFADHYDWADACYAALLGHIADGGTCTTDWECALGSICRNAVCARS
jgi:hypothetical protein